MDYKAYALMAILLASVASVALVSTANAQTASVTVKTDKTAYVSGENIIISGTVTGIQTGQQVLVRVYNEKDALARTDPVDVAADGSWTYTFKSGGPLMANDGVYTAKASYRGITEETTFNFDGLGAGPVWKTIMVNIGGNDYPIRYQITGGTLSSITADVPLSTLTANIASTAEGRLVIELPRTTMQALTVEAVPTGGEDINYEIFIDTIPGVIFSDDKSAANRVLTIDFEQGTEQIEIIGTWIVPEFGAIAAIVLAVAIVGIIVATTRYNKFSKFVPRL